MNVPLAGFLPPEVAELLASEREELLAPQAREATLLTAGLDVARLAESLQPDSLSRVLTDTLGLLEEIVRRHHGLFDAVAGQTAGALWNLPADVPRHQAAGCLAALETDAALDRLWREAGVAHPPAFQAALHCGTVFAGVMRFGQRLHYTAHGDAADLCPRLLAANKFFRTRLLATAAVLHGAAEAVEARPLGLVRVVGRGRPVELFELLAPRHALHETWAKGLPTYLEGFARFRARRFAEAGAAFKTVLDLLPDDGPAGFYAMAAADYAQNPPPEGWDGVLNLTA